MRDQKVSVFLALCLLGPSVAFAGARKLEVVVSGKSRQFALKDLQQQLKVKTVLIQDPVYKKQKKFDGFLLTDVLQLAGMTADSAHDEIVFTAKDGYAPNTTIGKLRAHRAVLVFQEHGTKLKFGKVQQGKSMVSPAPYYLVWEEGSRLAEEVPWPYQLVKIEVLNFAQKYDQAYPRDVAKDSAVHSGFLVFKDQCLRCHSVNLQGGDLGPELNAPMNITEYWRKDVLRSFIRDPTQFRYQSKMPSFTALKESELDSVLSYLEHMKKNKVIKQP